MDSFLIYKAILVLVIFVVSLVIAMYSTILERKFAAWIQDRVGPNRTGPGGVLQPLADGVKMFMKEDIIPAHAHKFLFKAGPMIAMTTALMASVVIPFGKTLLIGGKEYALQVSDLNIGILYVFAMVSIGVYGIMIGGWASNNKFSLLGALRASSQMISYELAMSLSLIPVIMASSTLSMSEIAQQQSGWHWNVITQPLSFIIFLICAFAETNRTPFDLPECETELIGGYHTEYSSMGLGLYLFAEYVNMFISSAVMVTLFFGGYNIPYIEKLGLAHNLETILGVLFFFVKTGFFILFFMWVRWTIPRFRFDQLMNLGWKYMIPLALINILVTGGLILIFDYFK